MKVRNMKQRVRPTPTGRRDFELLPYQRKMLRQLCGPYAKVVSRVIVECARRPGIATLRNAMELLGLTATGRQDPPHEATRSAARASWMSSP